MRVQCKNCLPKEGIDIPDFSQLEKLRLHDLKHASTIETVKYLIENYKLNHRDAKFVVHHIYTVYGMCNCCEFGDLHGEYVMCSKCKALNFNWKVD